MPKLAPPINAPVTTKFGVSGPRWSSGRHTGVDYSAQTGQPVRAAAAGIVKPTPYSNAYGNYVDIIHADGSTTRYAHLSSKALTLASVDQGDIIGYVGMTGNATGPHLHFELIIGGRAVDPEPYLSGKAISGGEVKTGSTKTSTSDVSALTDPDTWLRVAMFVGGISLAGVGGYTIIKGM